MKTTVYRALTTIDGAQVLGYLHAIDGEKTAVMIMHPRELLVSHYAVPYMLDAGYAAGCKNRVRSGTTYVWNTKLRS